MTTTTIKALPEELLLKVFDSVPLKETPSIWLTCPYWESLRHSTLARRTWLSLQVEPEYYKFYDTNVKIRKNDLYWFEFTPARVEVLSRCFTSLRKLKFSYIGSDRPVPATTLASLLELFRRWSSTDPGSSPPPPPLLELHLRIDTKFSPKFWAQLAQAIGGFGSLKVLNISECILAHIQLDSPSFPALARLKRLKVESGSSEELVALCRWVAANLGDNTDLEIFSSWKEYYFGERPTLEQIKQIYASGAPLHQWTGFFPEPRAIMTVSEMVRYLSHFPRLTTFTLFANRMSLAKMSRALAQLPELTKLSLFTPSDEFEDKENEDPQDLPTYHPLPSVRYIKFYLEGDYLLVDAVEQWPSVRVWATRPHATVFPGLKQLEVNFRGRSYFYKNKKTAREAKPLVLGTTLPYAQPFLTCAHLEKVRFISEPHRIFHEFTPQELINAQVTQNDNYSYN